jgi:prepilin-type N-terminal cleavage/methylation domain-containing protein
MKSRPTGRFFGEKRGFSLIELLVVMALIGLLSLFAIPAILKAMRRARVENTARHAQLVLSAARLQAIKMSRTVAVYFDTDSSGSTGYGRIVPFLDANANGTYEIGEEFGKLQAMSLPTETAFWQPQQTARDAATAVTFPNDIVAFNGSGQAIVLASGLVLTNCGDAVNGCALYIGDAPEMGYVPFVSGKQETNAFRVGIDNPGTGKVSFRKYDWGSGLYVVAPWKWTY